MEELDDGRLPRGDVAGQRDVQHCPGAGSRERYRTVRRRVPLPPPCSRSKQRRPTLIRPRDLMTMPAPRLVRLTAADQDRRALPQGRPAVDETLVAARRPAANYTDRLKLVDDLGDGEEGGHRTERQAAEIHVDPRQQDSNAAEIGRAHV